MQAATRLPARPSRSSCLVSFASVSRSMPPNSSMLWCFLRACVRAGRAQRGAARHSIAALRHRRVASEGDARGGGPLDREVRLLVAQLRRHRWRPCSRNAVSPRRRLQSIGPCRTASAMGRAGTAHAPTKTLPACDSPPAGLTVLHKPKGPPLSL